MARDIDSYLRELQAALAGADPALVQDALFDAEEHLQAELAAGGEFAKVVEDYGTPEEVAAAYVATSVVLNAAPVTSGEADAEAAGTLPAVVAAQTAGTGATGAAAIGAPVTGPTTVAGVAQPSVWRQIFGVVVDPRVFKALLYMIVSLGTGVAYFTIVVTGLSMSAGLLILVIGVPFLVLTLGVVRGVALFEGRLVELLLGTRMPRRPRSEPPGSGFVQRMWFWLKDGRTWASVVYLVLMLPLGVVYFTVAVTGLAVGFGLIALPFVQLASGHTWLDYGVNGVHEFLLPAWGMPLAVIGGALLLLGLLHVVRWIGRGHALCAKAMLVRLAK